MKRFYVIPICITLLLCSCGTDNKQEGTIEDTNNSKSTEIVTTDGKIDNLLHETIISGETLATDDTVGYYYSQAYQENDSGAAVGILSLEDNTYYVLYPYEEDLTAENKFKEICQDNGTSVMTRNELIPVVNEYISSCGYDVDISTLDENMVEWFEL